MKQSFTVIQNVNYYQLPFSALTASNLTITAKTKGSLSKTSRKQYKLRLKNKLLMEKWKNYTQKFHHCHHW